MKILMIFEDGQSTAEGHVKRENVEIEVTPKELLDACDETDILERLEVCEGGCFNENQNHCECNPEYEYFEFVEFKYVDEDAKCVMEVK